MVSRKREDPFTPEPSRSGIQTKKLKEYVSPVPRTPLRNVLTPDRHGIGSVVQTSSKKPPADQLFLPGSASRSRLASRSFECLDGGGTSEADEENSKHVKREELARKRKERKAALLSPTVGSSPKAAPPQSFSGSKKTALNRTPIASVIAGEIAARPLPGSSGQPKMSAEQMNKVFEEWIKIAADNKINSKNTWNLALIDYFSELTFLKDGNSINFQKASCTLDGCVKIYSSRVDSVVDETGKLLNGLAESSSKNGKYLNDGIGSSNPASRQASDDEEDEESVGLGKKKSVKKSGKHVNTLEKSAEVLTLKRFDLEYSVDPLFKKTCAEFDESSGRGQLVSSLALSGDGGIIFDSSITSPNTAGENPTTVQPSGRISLNEIKDNFASSIASITSRKLNASFAEYNFADSTAVEDQLSKAFERLEKFQVQPPNPDLTSSINAPSAVNHADMMELDGQVFDAPALMEEEDFTAYMDDDYGFDPAGYDDELAGGLPEDYNQIVEENEHSFLEAQGDAQITTAFTQSTSAPNMLSYFDETLKHTWAGPNHRKVRRPRFFPPRNTVPSSGQNGKRKDFTLEFNDSVEIDIEALFAKPANPSTISLSKTMIEERNGRDNLLPEDMHFSSQNFLRLFIKPSWRFGTVVSSARTLGARRLSRLDDLVQLAQGEEPQVAQNFWAQTEPHPEGVADANLPINNNNDEDGNFEVPFDDDYGFDGPDYDPLQMDDPNVEGGPSATQASSVNYGAFDLVALKSGVQVQRLAFSRVAKRVDVHKLKEAIWEVIEKPSPSSKTTKSKPSTGPKNFSGLLSGLAESSYPKEGLKDVSIPYCFICLLHLANENNLTINKDGADLVIGTK